MYPHPGRDVFCPVEVWVIFAPHLGRDVLGYFCTHTLVRTCWGVFVSAGIPSFPQPPWKHRSRRFKTLERACPRMICFKEGGCQYGAAALLHSNRTSVESAQIGRLRPAASRRLRSDACISGPVEVIPAFAGWRGEETYHGGITMTPKSLMRTQNVSLSFERADGLCLHLNIYDDAMACVVAELADGVIFYGPPVPVSDALCHVAEEIRSWE